MTWQEIARQWIAWADHVVLVYFFALNSHYLFLSIAGFVTTRLAAAQVQTRDLRLMMRSPLVPPVSMLVPAYNEAANIVQSVRSLLQMRYPQFEVVVVNDGSTDATLSLLIENFELRRVHRSFDVRIPCQPIHAVYESNTHRNLVVVDKVNGGKGDAHNAGINVARYPLFSAIDGDSILEPHALLHVVRPFHENPGVVVAAGGTVRIANGSEIRRGRVVKPRLSRALLPRIQVVEYLRAFLFGRMGWDSLNSLLLISGAFGVFEKRAVIEAGGYATDTVGEDLELVIRLHRSLRDQRRRYRISFVPEPVCWTEAPEDLRSLRSQRVRWQRGLIDSIVRHWDMLGHPRYGAVGLLSLPAYLLFEMLGPIVEVFGYVVIPLSFVLGIVDESFMITFIAAALLYAIVVSVLAVLLDDFTFRRYERIVGLLELTSAALIEAVIFRPLTAFWRIGGFWGYFRRDQSWGKVKRKGIATTG